MKKDTFKEFYMYFTDKLLLRLRSQTAEGTMVISEDKADWYNYPILWVYPITNSDFGLVNLGGMNIDEAYSDLWSIIKKTIHIKEIGIDEDHAKTKVKLVVTLDTSAIISELPTRLVKLGLIGNSSRVVIPQASILEIRKQDEIAKRQRQKNLKDKVERAFRELERLRRLSEEKRIILKVGEKAQKDIEKDILSSPDKPTLSALIDEEILNVSKKTKSLLLTCDKGLAVTALQKGIYPIFIKGERKELKAHLVKPWGAFLITMLWLLYTDNNSLKITIIRQGSKKYETKIGYKNHNFTIM